MELQEQIFQLFAEIRDNKDRMDDTLDNNIKKIKSLLSGKLDSKQTTIYLNWCNVTCAKFKDQYQSPIGGYFFSDEFENPILSIASDIENRNS